MSVLAATLLLGLGAAPLESADAAYAASDFKAAVEGYRRVISAGGLSLEELTRAYAGAALSSAALLDREGSRRAFVRVLALSPGWALPAEAGPKVRGPFDEARAFWSGKPPPRIELTHPKALGVGEKVVVGVRPTDPLELMTAVRLTWSAGQASGEELGPARADTLFHLRAGAPVKLSAQALDEHGSVVAESGERSIELRAAGEDPVDENGPISGQHWLHLRAAGFAQLLDRGFGAEVGLAVGLASFLELGVAATLGRHPGAQLFVGLHTGSGRVRPYAQLRGDFVPLPGGFAAGGGVLGGAQLALGPGHLFAGVVGEVFAAPAAYRLFSVSVSAGYELELFSADQVEAE